MWAVLLAQTAGGAADLAPYAQIGGQGLIVAILALVGHRMADGRIVPRDLAERERQYEQLVAQGVAIQDGLQKLLEASSKREDRLTDALRESNLLAGRLSVHIEELDRRYREQP